MKKHFLLILSMLVLTLSGCESETHIQSELTRAKQDTLQFIQNSRLSSSAQTSEQLASLREHYLRIYFSPWTQPTLFKPADTIVEQEKQILSHYAKNPGWAENLLPHHPNWAKKIAHNMNLATFPNTKLKAITIRGTNLRLLPTKDPSFNKPSLAGEGFPFDNLQNSYLRANEPIFIWHTSQNGAWQLISTSSDMFGWVNHLDIAYVDEAFIKQWQQRPFMAAIKDGSPITGAHKQFYRLSRIGELAPLIRTNKTHTEILVALRKLNGYAAIRPALIRREDATPIPLAASEKNIAQLANSMLGTPYGWGGLYGYRDCSATMKALFSPFSIWLPRHSSLQGKTGQFISFADLSNQQKIALLKQKGRPFKTIILLHGHVVLYIGEKKGEPYIFHAVWGVHSVNPLTRKDGRIIIGEAVVTPLKLGAGFLNVEKSLLDRARGMTLLNTTPKVNGATDTPLKPYFNQE